MKAMTQRRYGPSEVLELQEVETPSPAADEVLIRVRAASVNPYDWHMSTGLPYIARIGNGLRTPKQAIPGADVAGTVEAVGANVTTLSVGDDVFGACDGAFAEYVGVAARRLALKPGNVSFEQAAAVPIAALTALQGLRDAGRLQAGGHVLVNGASGGVGTFAVQIAKHLGAQVTAVCSTRNAEAARELGADRVIDYTREDFTRGTDRYDLILDIAGNRSAAARLRVLGRAGTIVVIGGPKGNRLLGPATALIRALIVGRIRRRRIVGMLAKPTPEDLETLRTLLETGRVHPVIERTYPLAELPTAMTYVGAGHARGKIVIAMDA
jgi:NADPH:quinone reductase-like Zn-dependent oxidoreductase